MTVEPDRLVEAPLRVGDDTQFDAITFSHGLGQEPAFEGHSDSRRRFTRMARSARLRFSADADPCEALAWRVPWHCSLPSLYDASSCAPEKWPSPVSDTELKQRLAAILAADVRATRD